MNLHLPLLAASTLALIAGFALGRTTAPESTAPEPAPGAERDEGEDDDEGAAEEDDSALLTCEARLSRAEEALTHRPVAAPEAPIDLAPLSEPTRLALSSPEATVAIEAEVERRIAEHFERERARRREEWVARRQRARERMAEIGIDEETLAQVTPALCAMRDVYRQAWAANRESGGAPDGGTRTGRRELRAATADMRREVENVLGPDRVARLEDEGGMRALGSAAECGDDEPPFGGGRR